MAKQQKHVQCRLERPFETETGGIGTSVQTSWIPQEFAQPGRVVKLKSDDGKGTQGDWDDGWRVTDVSRTHALDSKWVQEHSMDYKKMRKMTDI